MTAEANGWIVRPRPAPLARMRLFCFPIAGAHAGIFETFPAGLPEDVDVCAVQFPGRQQRAGEPPIKRMVIAVGDLDRAVRPLLDLPFAIFGLCTGSLVGYELAQRLVRTSGIHPVHLFASCCRAPHLPDRDKPIHALPDDELWSEVSRLGGTPAIVSEHPELRALLTPVLRADFELAETYRYHPGGPSLSCDVTAFGGIDDAIVDAQMEIAAWREHTSGQFALRMLPGGHYLLDADAARRELLQDMARALDDCLART